MKIAEISCTPENHRHVTTPTTTATHSSILTQFESTIKSLELHSPSNPLPSTFSTDLQLALTQLTHLAPFPNSIKLQIWKLSYRLWNACVDLSNSTKTPSHQHAALRHVASDLLLLTSDVAGIPSPSFKASLFFYKTALLYFDLKLYDLSNTCLEKATHLLSCVDVANVVDEDERKLLLDVNLARSRCVWEVKDRNLAVVLLGRSKNVLFGSSRLYEALASQYLVFGKCFLVDGEAKSASGLMNEALELCEKGLKVVKRTDETLSLKELRLKTLRFIAAAHLQGDDYEGVLRCVKVLRDVGVGGDKHPSLSVLAMKAWLGLGRYGEAEKELRGMVLNKGIPEGVWVSAVESYFQAAGAAGAETVRGVFMGLLERCHVSACAAIKIVNRLVGSGLTCGEGMKVRAGVVNELVSDERVVALFDREGADKERTTMHALLWNW